jgi:hypothetical protein
VLIFGGSGVYLVDMGTFDVTQSSLIVQTLYENAARQTEFARFTPDSAYVVVATSDWIGMYDTTTLERVALDSAAVLESADTQTIGDVLDVDVIDAL